MEFRVSKIKKESQDVPPIEFRHRKALTPIFIFLGLMIVGGTYALFNSPSASYEFVMNTLAKPIENIVVNLGQPLRQDNGRTNILVLGSGGVEHDGGNLTDTILVGSINHEDKTVNMISIPRDLYTEIPGQGSAKMNEVYWLGTKKFTSQEDQFLMVASVVEYILGIPIHYTTMVNFDGFTETIDIMGGVTVDIENAFTDSQYPDGYYGYKTISFNAGLQKLTGQQALEYVRSRHANEYWEVGDFARAKRQQRLIEGLRKDLLSLGILSSPRKIQKILNTVGDNIKSSLSIGEIITMADLARSIDKGKIHSLILDDGPSGLLYVPVKEIREAHYGGAYILLPDGGNFKAIHELVSNHLISPEKVQSGAKIEILNGTNVLGLADRFSQPLKAKGYSVANVANTHNRKRYKQSFIIDRRSGKHSEVIENIHEILSEAEVTEQNLEPNFSAVDVTVVLGSDYANR